MKSKKWPPHRNYLSKIKGNHRTISSYHKLVLWGFMWRNLYVRVFAREREEQINSPVSCNNSERLKAPFSPLSEFQVRLNCPQWGWSFEKIASMHLHVKSSGSYRGHVTCFAEGGLRTNLEETGKEWTEIGPHWVRTYVRTGSALHRGQTSNKKKLRRQTSYQHYTVF